MSLHVVFAKTKTDVIVDQLRDSVQSFDGTVTYENGTIDVNWNMPNSNTKELTFSYNGNVIEYNSGEITNYEMAEDVTDQIVFSTELMNGVLPINIYGIDNDNHYTSEILFERGLGLKYLDKADVEKIDELMEQTAGILNGDKEYTEDTFNNLKDIYDKVLEFEKDNEKLLVDKQDEIDVYVEQLQDSIRSLKAFYRILDGNNQIYKGEDISVRASGKLEDFVMLKIDGEEVDSSNYSLKSGSTIVTLNSNYLNTLSAGGHTLTFVYNDGAVDANFTIPSSTFFSDGNPGTNDNIMIYILLFVLSLSGCVLSVLYTRKKLHKNI